MPESRCPACGYTKADAQFHGDHHLCRNDGNAPWQKRPQPKGGDYRPHYNKREADAWMENLASNYKAALDREKVWLEVLDDLMVSIATANGTKINAAYKRTAMRITEMRQK